jgi:hypothetical protein
MGGKLNQGVMSARPIPRTVISRKLERVMGIEYIARRRLTALNHHVATVNENCVRFSCEKRCHGRQRQPTSPKGSSPLRAQVLLKRQQQFVTRFDFAQ